MGKLLTPTSYWLGYSEMNDDGLRDYLKASGNEEFWQSVLDARKQGVSNAEILCSFFAKLCYKSLTVGHNANISKVRDIPDNIVATMDSAHGSVFEHVGFNFVIHNCSRVFTHELVRHRIGTAFSQNSGRYCRLDEIDVIFDPILDPVKHHVTDIIAFLEDKYAKMCQEMGLNEMKDFTRKKKITSALRRIAPNGQSNDIGFSVNLRTLRHTVMLRTARHAEWEIRLVFNQLYLLLKDKYPYIFYGAKEEMVDGLLEVSGMKLQPYEKESSVVLEEASTEDLERILAIRRA